jgi:cyclase
MEQQTLPVSEHFELKELAKGVYAALGLAGSPTFSNAGIVDLGDQTLVFDAFELPTAGADLRAAAEQLTGRPVTCLVLSHSHSDHSVGGQAFGLDTPFLSTKAIRDEIPDSTDWLQHFQAYPDELEAALRFERERLESTTDEALRASIVRAIARLEHLLVALPDLSFRLPDLTFDGPLVFHGSQRTVELHIVAPGHTVSDVYLLLPEDRICFMGDLGFLQQQPFMVFCHPEAWVDWLAQAEQLDVDVFVPGHGPLGSKADLALQRRYITDLQALVAQAVADGTSAEETLTRQLPAPFDAWIAASPPRWEANVFALHERLAGEAAN